MSTMHGWRRSVGHSLAEVGVEVLRVVTESRLLLLRKLLTDCFVGGGGGGGGANQGVTVATAVVAVLRPTRLLLVTVDGSYKKKTKKQSTLSHSVLETAFSILRDSI